MIIIRYANNFECASWKCVACKRLIYYLEKLKHKIIYYDNNKKKKRKK